MASSEWLNVTDILLFAFPREIIALINQFTVDICQRYWLSGTNSADALMALETLFQQQGRQQQGVPIMSIFMTDGQSNNRVATAAAANSLHSNMTEVSVKNVVYRKLSACTV